jgi:signal peptidase II
MKAVPLNRYPLFFSIATLGCLLDLATKRWAFHVLGMPGGPIRWLWPGRVGLQTSLNEGALFGLGQGWVALFAALSVVAAVGILLWLFYAGAARELLLTIALGCITAGIFGNLYDRLGLPGLTWLNHPAHDVGEPVYAVRDWILVMIFGRPWPNFNVADILLVCGASLLIWHALFSKPGEHPSATNGAGPTGLT